MYSFSPEQSQILGAFAHLTEEELETHLAISRYGDFVLTDAVRPAYDLKVVPSAGYRFDMYDDKESNTRVPVIMAAATRRHLFSLFMELMEPLGETVDVVLETSHRRKSGGHIDLYRECIDAPVLKSTLYDFEDLLLNDGCTGIAVLNPDIPQELQWDEHKLFIIFGAPLENYQRIFHQYIRHRQEMQFITEAEHVHSSSDDYKNEFDKLAMRLGMDGKR